MPAAPATRDPGPRIPGNQSRARSRFDVLVRELRRRAGQPAVGDRLPQRLPGDLPQLDKNGGIPVEVRNREESTRMRGEHSLFLAEILDADSQDGPLRRGLVAEPPAIPLPQRPFPSKPLPADEPTPSPLPSP